MRSSTILTLIGATLAVASPVHQHLHKKAIVWDIETVIEYVTITDDGHLPKTTPKPEHPKTVTIKSTHWVQPVEATTHSSKKPVPTTTSTPPPPPPPAPTTSSTSSTSTTPPPPPPATTEAPAPTTEAPAPTTEAPAPAPETTIEAAVFAATSVAPAPVVETPTTAAAPASNAAPSDYASTGVHYHNLHRANHSAPALTWDTTLAGYAQQVANKCVFAHDLTPGGGGYGQNIDSVGYSAPVDGWNPSDVLANSITNDWYYAETGNYAGLFGQSSPSEGSAQFLHFTQIVWKSTTTVGCGSASCPKDALFPGSYGWFTVCNYGPAGNYMGEFATEVTKAVEGADSAVVVPAPWNI